MGQYNDVKKSLKLHHDCALWLNYIFVDKVIEDNDNIREVLAISKEPLGTEVKEIADIIEAEGETKVDVEEDSKNSSQGKTMTSLEEAAKVKELEKIIVDTKDVDNTNDKINLPM